MIKSIQSQASCLTKSSPKVSLVLLGGTALLTACQDYDGVREPNKGETRYDYRNRQDCVAEWGEQCPSEATGNNANSGLYHYYRYEQTPKSAMESKAVEIERGGFGKTAKKSSSS